VVSAVLVCYVSFLTFPKVKQTVSDGNQKSKAYIHTLVITDVLHLNIHFSVIILKFDCLIKTTGCVWLLVFVCVFH